MRHSDSHILTSHVGSLPRPEALIEANRARDAGEPADEPRFSRCCRRR
jgi:5-methyltetrahydropteroyltriglutamate--homocysteine methyltransferase